MSGDIGSELWLSWHDAWVTVVTAVAVYAAAIALSRLFGQRQFAQLSSFDLAFIFALGTLLGRSVLVRTSLGGGVVGLTTMFVLHAGVGALHHRLGWAHRLMENKPVVVVAHGEVWEEGLRLARMSESELQQQLRLRGHGSLRGMQAVILERNGNVSVIAEGAELDPGMLEEVVGAERVLGRDGG